MRRRRGRHLVPRLARDGYECRIVTRNPEAVRPLSTQGRLGQVVPWTADLRSDAALARVPGEHRLVLPMRPGNRSLNLSNAVAVVAYEAWRQLEFTGAG